MTFSQIRKGKEEGNGVGVRPSGRGQVWNDNSAREDTKEGRRGGEEGEGGDEMRHKSKIKFKGISMGRRDGRRAAKLDRIGPTALHCIHSIEGISCIVTSLGRVGFSRIFPRKEHGRRKKP